MATDLAIFDKMLATFLSKHLVTLAFCQFSQISSFTLRPINYATSTNKIANFYVQIALSIQDYFTLNSRFVNFSFENCDLIDF